MSVRVGVRAGARAPHGAYLVEPEQRAERPQRRLDGDAPRDAHAAADAAAEPLADPHAQEPHLLRLTADGSGQAEPRADHHAQRRRTSVLVGGVYGQPPSGSGSAHSS